MRGRAARVAARVRLARAASASSGARHVLARGGGRASHGARSGSALGWTCSPNQTIQAIGGEERARPRSTGGGMGAARPSCIGLEWSAPRAGAWGRASVAWGEERLHAGVDVLAEPNSPGGRRRGACAAEGHK